MNIIRDTWQEGFVNGLLTILQNQKEKNIKAEFERILLCHDFSKAEVDYWLNWLDSKLR